MLSIADYQRPETLEHALALLSQPDCKPLAGGTDLVAQLRGGRHGGVRLVDLCDLAEPLGQVRQEGDFLRLGALCTHHQLAGSDVVRRLCPALASACAGIGAAQIRKRATLGGNLANASPAADALPVLVAAGAVVTAQAQDGRREIPVEALCLGPGKTQLRHGELLTEISIPLGGDAWGGMYQKIGARNALLIAVASVAVLRHRSLGWRIACGSVGPTVARAGCAEAVFAADGASLEDFRQALGRDICPISDVRASAHYRAQALGNLLWNCYQQEREG